MFVLEFGVRIIVAKDTLALVNLVRKLESRSFVSSTVAPWSFP